MIYRVHVFYTDAGHSNTYRAGGVDLCLPARLAALRADPTVRKIIVAGPNCLLMAWIRGEGTIWAKFAYYVTRCGSVLQTSEFRPMVTDH